MNEFAENMLAPVHNQELIPPDRPTYSLELPVHIDSTMISCFRACPRKFMLEFGMGLRPNLVSVDLHAGGCFALALEVIYRCVHDKKMKLSDAMAVGHMAFLREWGDFEIPEWKRTAKTKDRTWEAVEDYIMIYQPLTDDVQPYTSADGKATFEYTFAIPLLEEDGFPLHPSGQNFMYSGRFDMLGTYMGKTVVRDEKTTGSTIGEDWARKWDLRSQFMGYLWACNIGGIATDTVVVRGIAIQKTKFGHSQAVKTFNNMMIERWYFQLRRDMWRLRKCWDDGYFDYNFGDACNSFGNCIFMDVCQSAQPESWYNDFKVFRWNPLEKNPVKGLLP